MPLFGHLWGSLRRFLRETSHAKFDADLRSLAGELKPADVLVVFRSERDGGRHRPPGMGHYACTTEIDGRHWSIAFSLDEEPASSIRMGKARFLVSAAPWDKFKPGFKMALYEGPKLVGAAEVLR